MGNQLIVQGLLALILLICALLALSSGVKPAKRVWRRWSRAYLDAERYRKRYGASARARIEEHMAEESDTRVRAHLEKTLKLIQLQKSARPRKR